MREKENGTSEPKLESGKTGTSSASFRDLGSHFLLPRAEMPNYGLNCGPKCRANAD
ncbi:MAG: hypothetical protein IJD43_05235 [Thermoguttaceae bacterium]|nr:hypothetical protein [Thermoguttaceae bacterium]